MIRSLILQMGGVTDAWTLGFPGPFIGLLIMAAIVFILWSFFDTGPSAEGHTPQTDDAVETLRKRDARGDIDEDTDGKRARTLWEGIERVRLQMYTYEYRADSPRQWTMR